jgi:Zn finger protein HypA/HybF involved in hydrogenase expression
MKNCNKCGNEFEPVKGLKSYCSIECRNSRTWSEADKIKKSKSAKQSDKVKEANRKNANNTERIKKYKQRVKENREIKIIKIMETPFEQLTWSNQRLKIYYEQECKCNNCGNGKWQGEDIPLELEHKDGDHFNNDRNNLELLCPNCHALTDTWRGRNKKRKRPNGHKVTDERLLDALLNNEWNMRQALIEVKLAPKGANYPRCHRIKREYFG